MFIESYLTVAEHLVMQYNLEMPLYTFVKEYFKRNKKFGSRDRRYITELVFGFYRIPIHVFSNPRLQLILGSFLSGRLPKLFFDKLDTELANRYEDAWTDKLTFVEQRYQLTLKQRYLCSEAVDVDRYTQYLFQPKRVFIRIRRNMEGIERKLQLANISFQHLSNTCISLDEKIDLKEILPDIKDYVIQDIATQQIGPLLNPKENEVWWDCCAASGGKALMLLDKKVPIDLFVSDIRERILDNLRIRLSTYDYELGKRVLTIDVSQALPNTLPKAFDHIICDVPCSGSGTWAQAPEQDYFFSEKKLADFSKLQRQIAQNVLTRLKPKGFLYYITCSVFAQENEQVVQYLLEQNTVTLLHAELIDQSDHGGDFIFVSILQKV